MLKIGEFSKFTCISIRMLRYYDEIGLLPAERIDLASGYRYYSINQLLIANTIQSLKQMGFGINAIKEIINGSNDSSDIKKHMNIKLLELKEQKETIEKQMKLLKTSMLTLDSEGINMEYNVVIKDFKEMNIAYYRDVVPTYNEMGLLWNKLGPELIKNNIGTPTPCYSMAIFHDIGHKEKDVDISVCVSVNDIGTDTDNMKFRKFENVTVASVIFNGGHYQIPVASRNIGMWISKNNYKVCAPNFIIYHVGPYNTDNSNEFITEVCFPISAL